MDADVVIERGGTGIDGRDTVAVGLGDEDGGKRAGGGQRGDADGKGVNGERGLDDVAGDQCCRIGEEEGIERAFGVDGVALGSVGIEGEVAGIGEDLRCGEDRIPSEVDDSQQAERGGAGAGDSDSVLGRLASGANGADGADDWAILVTAANSGDYGGETDAENGSGCETIAAETLLYWLVHTRVAQISEQTVLPGRCRFDCNEQRPE